MLLKTLTLRNFRCYAELADVPLHRLTVFIGENDAGKSALLEAVKLLLTDQRPAPEQYYQVKKDVYADTTVICGRFELEDYDTLPEDLRSMDGTTLTVIKTFSDKQGNKKCEVLGRGFCDERFNIFKTQPADTQRELLKILEITPGSNATTRIDQFQEAIATGKAPPKKECCISVTFAELQEYLPLFESIASADYKQPDTLVQRTLQNVAAACLQPVNSETQEPELLPALANVKLLIHKALNEKVAEMKDTLGKQIPKIKDVQVSPPVIDFARSVAPMSLMLDLGQGLQMVSAFGAGTNKKLWMGLLDWERQIQQEYEKRTVIRVYDEPDVNLDYAAERKLFGHILDATNKSSSRTQALVATHSVTLVDRAPAQSINLIRVNDDGTRSVLCLCGDTDDGIKQFLTSVGRSVGISNSALFYERVFLVVEGETEENTLPILYRHCYSHSLIEDGIVLINLQTCGAWRSVLGVLCCHKAESTILLLDTDCTEPDASAKVTPDVLSEIGFPLDWHTRNCYYAGKKEFEDEFPNEVITETLNQHWPKADSTLWIDAEIENLRANSAKFSEDLKGLVRQHCVKQKRNSVRKPDLAEKLAQNCCLKNHIPLTVGRVFDKARTLSGM